MNDVVEKKRTKVSEIPKPEEKFCAYTLNVQGVEGKCLGLKCHQYISFTNDKGEIVNGSCAIPTMASGIVQLHQSIEALNINIQRLAFARGGHRG